jgi:hypothetical protein
LKDTLNTDQEKYCLADMKLQIAQVCNKEENHLLEPNLYDSGLEALEKYPHIEHANAGTNHSTTKCSHN